MNLLVDKIGTFDHLKGGREDNNLELIKYGNQTRRFVNSALKGHLQLGNIRNALQVIQPKQLLEVLQNTGSALGGLGEKTIIEQERPLLAPPRSTEPQAEKKSESDLNGSARATGLLGRMMQLCTQASQQNILANVSFFNALLHGQGVAYLELSAALEKEGMQWANDFDALKAALAQVDVLQKNIISANDVLKNAERYLNGLEVAATQQDPVSTELQMQIDVAKAAVAEAQGNVTTAVANHSHYIKANLNPAMKAESDAKAALAMTQQKAQELVRALPAQQFRAIEGKIKQQDPQAKGLTFLMALLSQLINQSSSEDLKATAELKQKLSEAAAKDAEKKVQEYEEQVRKAEEMQKTMGCVGKILGWAITAVSFTAAAFTGGASLALAAVGLALAVGDEINQAVNGFSFMAKAMEPMMDYIVKPMMEFMAAIYAEILQGFGVDKESAETIGQIMGAIAAAAAMIAGVMVAGSALSKVFGSIMQKIGSDVAEEVSKNVAVQVEKVVAKDITQNVVSDVVKESAKEVSGRVTRQAMQRLMNSTLGQVFKRVSQGMGRSLSIDEHKMAQIATRTQMASTIASMGNTTIQGISSVITAEMLVEAAKSKAHMMKDAAMQDLLNEMMNRAVDTFTHRMETVNSIIKNMSAVAENQAQAGKYITRQMSMVAG
ncbi:type III secretion system translocon subunit SctE [Erwinia piriflorinigrans]|uniref:Cell invasion protein sipB n=1 Tax=Erwinia piriflorinigrans CFBP 5888 TaxID=1161919 RepID=V5Z5M9_9GAMM|nr:type III secretion system translocon subunit SctE [Erwinia piriflorinigrans]CCG86237.1 Cell invasion protein sipB [Erwinia piriflorinigrans CFBP 5888]